MTSFAESSAARSPAHRPGRLARPRAIVAAGAPAALLGLLGLAALVGAWALLATTTTPTKIPSPGAVLDAVRNDWSSMPALQYVAFQSGGIGSALLFTGLNVVVAVAIGTVLGVLLGVWLAWNRRARLLLEPPLLILGTVPLLVLLPFITLWFGTARTAQSALVLVFTVLTVSLAAQNAAGTVGAHYGNAAAALGASSQHTLRTVVLPAAMPNVLAAVRLALAAGWGWQCAAELLGAGSGVGRLIQVTAQLQSTEDMLAALACLAVLAVLVDALVALVGGYIVRWKE